MLHPEKTAVAPWLLAAAGYSALIVVFTWPLAIQLSSVLPHDLGDPLFGAYLLWWNAHAVPLTERWWNAPFFHPATGAMGLSEHLLGLSVVATPLQWFGADPITAYNIIFLASFPLAALGAHALVYRLTGRHDAAALAGILFGFSPYRTAQIAHIQMLWTFWLPIALLALHRYAADGRARWLVLFGVMFLGQAASNGYFLLFVPLLVGLWAGWFFLREGQIGRFVSVAAAGAAASIPLVPILLGYRRIHEQYALERSYGEIRQYSADLLGFLTTAPSLRFWPSLAEAHRGEQEVFTGLTPVVLVLAAGLPAILRRSGRSAPYPKIRAAFGVVAAAGLAAAVSSVVSGPWEWWVGGLRILTVTTPTKPLTVFIWALIGVALTSDRARAVLSSRSSFAFYALAAGLMYLLCLGPDPTFNDFPFWYKGPYTLLMQFPGFASIRVPSRFATLGTLCLAVAASLALVRLTRLRSPRVARAVGAAVCACALVDCWMSDIPLPRIPPRIQALETPGGAPVVELPLGDVDRDLAAMYRSMYHEAPVVNGYAGFNPAAYDVLRVVLGDGDIRGLDALESPLRVAIDPSANDTQWKPLAPLMAAAEVDAGTGRRIISLPAGRVTARDPSTRLLPIQAVTASAPVDLAWLTDGDVFTFWDARTEETGSEWIQFDLGAVREVSALTLAVGAAYGGHARAISIDVSTDGGEWTTVFADQGGAQAVRGAQLDARLRAPTYPFAPAAARFVRARQTGRAARFHWSICEASVYGR